MQYAVTHKALDRRLGSALFPPRNWHQSLSDRYWPDDEPGLEQRLLRACARISAQRVRLLLNRIAGKDGHWAFRTRGKPPDFAALLFAVGQALSTEDLENGWSAITVGIQAGADARGLPSIAGLHQGGRGYR